MSEAQDLEQRPEEPSISASGELPIVAFLGPMSSYSHQVL
jgi:hypothetical protein